jgi:hypothetical protein
MPTIATRLSRRSFLFSSDEELADCLLTLPSLEVVDPLESSPMRVETDVGLRASLALENRQSFDVLGKQIGALFITAIGNSTGSPLPVGVRGSLQPDASRGPPAGPR